MAMAEGRVHLKTTGTWGRGDTGSQRWPEKKTQELPLSYAWRPWRKEEMKPRLAPVGLPQTWPQLAP